MEENNSSRFESIGNTVRKRRSHTSRRPRPESQPLSDGRDVSSLSSTPPSDDIKAGSSDENSGGDHNSRRNELSLSQCASRFPGPSGVEGEKSSRKNKKVDIGLNELYGNGGSKDTTEQGRSGSNHKRSSEGVLAPANWRSTSRENESPEPQTTMALNRKADDSVGPSQDRLGNDNKVKKVKLKVGGVTRTIDANSKSSRASDATNVRQKSAHKDNSEIDKSPSGDKKGGLQGIPWKDFFKVGFTLGREESSTKGAGKNRSVKQGDKSDSARKSRRASKKRALDGFDDEDDDDEIRYLEKLKNAKYFNGFGEDDEESSRKHRRLSKFSGNVSQNSEVGASSRPGKDGKKRSPSEDTDYEGEEELVSDGEAEGKKKKKAKKEPVDAIVEPKRELTLTTRQRALQSGRDCSAPGGTAVEFPNGLPPAPSRKQKEKLSEVDQQLKKVEAAQRRKMQNEKAAKESEAEAIRRILGQDSNRKKREDKKKKRVKELAQERAADELMRASNSIRMVLGPSGTTVTFPKEMLPSFFDPKPCSYPPPRERCAGPSCTNPYKYRDSKTKLPLCSLQCYKAVQGNMPSQAATC
ncbi:protein IWS1 homolog [Chenopodium quinoa]|uniref:protein IWS1 homolog n=1 Tax=Chenopodium quinoa TaxID=63459 RepID=UPI000B78FAC9|nr:protein IWS1 homolog [Chenopodium quinoa]